MEPEIHFIHDTVVMVPDIAGWRKERMPHPPRTHRCEVVPDWIEQKKCRAEKSS